MLLSGGRVLPEKVPWKPMLTVAPEASEPFQAALRTVIWLPDWDQSPFQPLLRLTLDPAVKARVQLLTEPPVLVIRTSRVKPPGHWFVV